MNLPAGSSPAYARNGGRQWRLAAELFTYNTLLLAGAPAIACWLLWRALRRKALGCWRHRLGLVPRLPVREGPRIWLHAVSAGEVGAAKPVLEALRQGLPGARIALSTVTQAGMTIARKSCGSANVFLYLPLDVPAAMGLALSRLRPDLVVVTEKELWPNFLGLARLSGARVLMVNGRVSNRMAQRARWAGRFVQWLYRLPDRLCVQSQQDARRLVDLGVEPARILVAGNTKVDGMAERDQQAEAKLAAELAVSPGDLWLVAGSTHPGEEEAVIEAFRLIRSQLPGARLLLAPRHLERVPAISALVAQRGFPVVRRSERAAASAAPVVVLDTMGELRAAYGCATAAFVGGTLAPVGGHNLLEPVAAGRPVLFGPHTEECADMADLVLESGVGFRVSSGAELAGQFIRLAADASLRARIAATGEALIAGQRGAARRCAEAAQSLLGLRAVS